MQKVLCSAKYDGKPLASTFVFDTFTVEAYVTRSGIHSARGGILLIGSIAELGDQLVVEVIVSNLDRSLALYTALGFTLERRDGNFAVLLWEGRRLFLDQGSDLAPLNAGSRANIRILTRDVDAVWTVAQKLGISVERSIGNRDYGLRDFTVLDPDGFGLRFASTLPVSPRS
jgi:catechol 2,3-dioxygenase-like lactoylglutathione lyase family enzyme